MTCYYLLNLYRDRLLLYNRLALYCVLKDIIFNKKIICHRDETLSGPKFHDTIFYVTLIIGNSVFDVYQ